MSFYITKILFNITPWYEYPLHCHSDGEHGHLKVYFFPFMGTCDPQRYIKGMYMHERQAKDMFSSEKVSITLILNIQTTHSLFCSGSAWCGCAQRLHQSPRVAMGQLDTRRQDRGGWVRSERKKKVQIQASSLHWPARGEFIAVSRR